MQYAWLIWSIEHNGWWAPDHAGYVEERAKAGRYTFEEATEICRKSRYAPETRNRPNETMQRDESLCCKAPMVNGGVQCENCGSDGL